tara:strand:- start:246 stop:563 length:318 start_codon:yes stop_codon:yes gene_type:complete
MKLSQIILEDDYWSKFTAKSQEIENEMKDVYNRDDIRVSIVQHSNGDKAMGKVTIVTPDQLLPSEYQNMRNYLEAKDYEVTGGMNFAETDDDRRVYPDIKFEFEI